MVCWWKICISRRWLIQCWPVPTKEEDRLVPLKFASFANLDWAIIEESLLHCVHSVWAEDNGGQDEIGWFTTMSHWNTIVSKSEWWVGWQGLQFTPHSPNMSMVVRGARQDQNSPVILNVFSNKCKVVHFQFCISEQKPIPISWLMFVA